MASFVHPSIGEVIGNEKENITQFLGIKYGLLKDRFSVSQPVHYNGTGINATKFGPQVISPPEGVDIELSFIQKTLPKPEFPGVSDTEGLNLNITVPTKASAINGKTFPVLVFIHGGGFAIGGNWWPQYDGAALVKLSQDIGKPIISVNLNYRVGAPGFLTSPELRAMGYKPNNGLRDQQVALSWIQDNIKGFGGDPENLTVIGESAGGVSAGYLLLAENPRVRRLVCLGGAPPLLGQLPIDAADAVAQRIQVFLGLADVSSSEIVQHLLDLPIESFWKRIPMTQPLVPVIDGDILPSEIALRHFSAEDSSTLPGAQRVESILLGDSKLDASILAYSGLLQRKEGIATAFRESIAKTLSRYPDAILAILEHYSLGDSTPVSDDDAFWSILNFINDVAFSMPVVEIASHFPQKSYVLAFNEPNPWDGLFKGQSSHILDVAFLFQNFNDHLSPEQKAGAIALGTDIISYVSGEEPWPPFNRTQHGMGVYEGGKRKFVEPPTPEGIGRHPFLLSLSMDSNGPSKDDLLRVFSDFMAQAS